MIDPITITVFACACIGMLFALWPVITGNPDWLKDRRSELAAAACSAVLIVWCLGHREPQVVEKPVVVKRDVTPEEAMEIVIRDRATLALKEHNGLRK